VAGFAVDVVRTDSYRLMSSVACKGDGKHRKPSRLSPRMSSLRRGMRSS
jgi:hypothetical protein